MNKKIKAIILLAIMGTLYACGNGNNNTKAPSTTIALTVPATSSETIVTVTSAQDTTLDVTTTPVTEALVSTSETSISSPLSNSNEKEVTSVASETNTPESSKVIETTMALEASKAQSSISSSSGTLSSGIEKSDKTLNTTSVPVSVPLSSQPAKNISSASSVPESAKNISMATDNSLVSVPVKVKPVTESNASNASSSSSAPVTTSEGQLIPVSSSSSVPFEKKTSLSTSVSSNASGTLKPVASSQSSSPASNTSIAGESKGSGVEVIQDEMIEKVKLKYFDGDKKLYKFSTALFMSPGDEFKGYRQGDYVGFEKNENEYMGFFKFPKNSEKPVTQEDLDAVYKSMYQNIDGAGKKVIFADKEGKPVAIYEGTADYKGQTIYFKNYFIGNGREIYIVTSVAESMSRADANLNKFVNSLSFTE